jgi:hypothetical protein
VTTAISAVRRQVREMVDGTLEVRLHVSPTEKAAFHQLFPEIDMPVALAPLKLTVRVQEKPAEPKESVGPLCQLAVQWCKDEAFQYWSCPAGMISAANPFGQPPNEQTAKQFILNQCQVASRRELDTNEQAANRFHTLIRIPYMKHIGG